MNRITIPVYLIFVLAFVTAGAFLYGNVPVVILCAVLLQIAVIYFVVDRWYLRRYKEQQAKEEQASQPVSISWYFKNKGLGIKPKKPV